MVNFKNFLMVSFFAVVFILSAGTQAQAHCGMCGVGDDHAEDAKHAAHELHEDKVMNGADFRKTAEEYTELSEHFREKGKTELADDYARMAEIKTEAAELGDQGKWDDIDWTEYKEIETRVEKKMKAAHAH